MGNASCSTQADLCATQAEDGRHLSAVEATMVSDDSITPLLEPGEAFIPSELGEACIAAEEASSPNEGMTAKQYEEYMSMLEKIRVMPLGVDPAAVVKGMGAACCSNKAEDVVKATCVIDDTINAQSEAGVYHEHCQEKCQDYIVALEHASCQELCQPGGRHDGQREECREYNGRHEQCQKKCKEQSQEYTIVLEKTGGMTLGLDVDTMAILHDSSVLPIRAISGGLVGIWNKHHPDMQVLHGDKIIEVNGVRGDVASLVEKCAREQTLSMVLKRASLKLEAEQKTSTRHAFVDTSSCRAEQSEQPGAAGAARAARIRAIQRARINPEQPGERPEHLE